MDCREKPLTPAGAIKRKADKFPKEVIASFNKLISLNHKYGCSYFKEKEVLELMIKKGLDKDEILEKKWLEVQDLYSDHGWDVNYHRPNPSETFDASFKFTPKEE